MSNKDLDDLQSKIQSFQKKNDDDEAVEKKVAQSDNMSMGIRAGAELLVPILVAGFIGYQIDGWLETKPIFLIILLLLGMGAGFLNVYRITVAIDQNSAPNKKDHQNDDKQE